VGYNDLFCTGSKDIATPNLDAFAKEGVRLTSFYAPSSTCPRAALLRKQGYATALIGKWHRLNARAPADESRVRPLFRDPLPQRPRAGAQRRQGRPRLPAHPACRGTKIVEQPATLAFLPEGFVEESVRFITDHKDRPFFLHLANIETHTPWFVSKRFQGKSKAGRYGDAVECMDWMVGEILATLKKLGLEKKTLVVFTSDNGPLVKRYE